MNRNSKITKEALEDLYTRQQLSTPRVADILGVSRYGVYNGLRRFGIEIRDKSEAARGKPKKYVVENWNSVAKNYLSGKTMEVLAGEIGCSVATVWLHLKESNVPIQKDYEWTRKYRKNVDIAEVISLNKSGVSSIDIARKVGVSPQILHKRFKEAGYTPRRPPKSFITLNSTSKRVAREIDASYCRICHESRAVDLCHVTPKKLGGPMSADNVIPLCANHHRCFDKGLLTDKESKKIFPLLRLAAKKGYHAKHYRVGEQ